MATKKITLSELRDLVKQIINEGLPIGNSKEAQDAANKLNTIISIIDRPDLSKKANFHASEIIRLIDEDNSSMISEEQEKYSYESKTVYGMEYLFAYPDKRGNDTREGLEKWEMSDTANRQLQFVSSKKEASDAIKSFGRM